jgi:hypothetical protein
LISKRDLINRLKEKEAAEQNNSSNLSQSTLDHMAENKRLVDAGLLPKYVDGGDVPSNPEVETQAETVYRFTHILGNRKSRNEY